MNQSLNHRLSQFNSNSWFHSSNEARWLSLWMSHWIISSLNSIKLLIHSVMKLATLFMNQSLNHQLSPFNQTPDSFSNEASDSLYESVTESSASLNSIKLMIHSVMKQHYSDCLWISHWIIGSLNSIKLLIHSVMKLVTLFMNESLNHQLSQFNQTPDSFSNEASDSLYESVTESSALSIQSNSWFIQ